MNLVDGLMIWNEIELLLYQSQLLWGGKCNKSLVSFDKSCFYILVAHLLF